MMNILVSGGAGFIGSNIVSALTNAGHNLTVLDNLSTGFETNLKGLEAELVKGDILDTNLLDRVMKGKDAIYHLAASVGNLKSIEFPGRDMEVNYGGTLNLLEAAKRNGVSRFVFSSTAAGYGEPKHLPVDEDHPMNPDSPYGVSKISAEKLALCYGRLYDMQVACLRYFNAYGVNQRYDAYGNVIPMFCFRIAKGEGIFVYGDGTQTRDFINVDDIARANTMVLEKNITGYYNIASGVGTSINELVRVLKETTTMDFPVEYKPFRKGEVKHSVADIAKAAQSIDYKPAVDLKSGLDKYWKWLQTIL